MSQAERFPAPESVSGRTFPVTEERVPVMQLDQQISELPLPSDLAALLRRVVQGRTVETAREAGYISLRPVDRHIAAYFNRGFVDVAVRPEESSVRAAENSGAQVIRRTTATHYVRIATGAVNLDRVAPLIQSALDWREFGSRWSGAHARTAAGDLAGEVCGTCFIAIAVNGACLCDPEEAAIPAACREDLPSSSDRSITEEELVGAAIDGASSLHLHAWADDLLAAVNAWCQQSGVGRDVLHLLYLLATAVRTRRVDTNPFSGYLEAPAVVVEVYQRHGNAIVQAGDAWAEAMDDLLRDIASSAYRSLSEKPTWSELEGLGARPDRPEPPLVGDEW